MLLPPRAGSAPRRRRLYKGGHVTPGGGAHWAAPAGCYKTRRFCNAPTTAPARPAEGARPPPPPRRGQQLPGTPAGVRRGRGEAGDAPEGVSGPGRGGARAPCQRRPGRAGASVPSGAAAAPPRPRSLLLSASVGLTRNRYQPALAPRPASPGRVPPRAPRVRHGRAPHGGATGPVPTGAVPRPVTLRVKFRLTRWSAVTARRTIPNYPWASQLWHQRDGTLPWMQLQVQNSN